MNELTVNRRRFNRDSLALLLSAATGAAFDSAAYGQVPANPKGAGRRDVIKQELPGEPLRDLLLVEVTYPPGAGSPAHLHANGVMAFVVSGTVVSKVDDGPERAFHAGEAWWEPPGAVHRISRNASASEPATLLAIYIAAKDATGPDLMKPL